MTKLLVTVIALLVISINCNYRPCETAGDE